MCYWRWYIVASVAEVVATSVAEVVTTSVTEVEVCTIGVVSMVFGRGATGMDDH
jgi:hypothetical protein